MAEFKLERFKYIWKGPWVAATVYKRDDVVRVGGKSYVCLKGHTADASFETDLKYTLPDSNPPEPQPKWRLMTSGRQFVGVWATATTYNDSDIVIKDGNVWVCNEGHTSSTFVTDSAKWDILASGQQYVGDWVTATDYSKGALAKYNGIVYKCIEPHVSQTFLEDNLVTTPSTLTVTVQRNLEDTANVYNINGTTQPTITLGKGKTYIIDQTDQSNNYFGGALVDGVEQNNPHPLLLSATEDGTFGGGTLYGDGVTYFIDGVEVSQSNYIANFSNLRDENGDVITKIRQLRITVPYTAPENLYYYCRYHSGMGADFTVQTTNEIAWEVFYDGVYFVGPWTFATLYKKNDLVLYGGSMWKCSETHTSAVEGLLTPVVTDPITGVQTGGDPADQLDTTKFALELPGFQYESTYSPTTQYQVGDVVRYGGTLYYAKSANISDQPAQGLDSTDSWTELQEGYAFRGTWDKTEVYNPGDIVQRGGDLYKALISIGSVEPDGSSTDYLDNDWWELMIPSKAWSNNWTSGVDYFVGEIIYFYGTAYVANVAHRSADNNFPGDNGSGFAYWDVLIQAGVDGGLAKQNDLLTYNLNRTGVGDGSSLGATNIPIGIANQVLGVDNDDTAFWKTWIDKAAQVYVAPHGVDAPTYGEEYSRPFKTVRYACEYIEDTYAAGTPSKVTVSTGRYDEICPISIPAGCVVMGDELRSTTLNASSPIAEYLNEYEYQVALSSHIDSFLLTLLSNDDVARSAGNTTAQAKTPIRLTITEANLIIALKTDYLTYIDYATRSGSINPTVVGTNTLTSQINRRNTAIKLNSEVEFIIAEVLAWTAENYPSKVYTTRRLTDDMRALIRGICYDLKYEGNFKTLLAAERYSNAHNGSQLSDFFRVRDITGIRQCTLSGLSGNLNPPGVYDLYQRPTAGAYTALDPGWGPADNRTWISSRSPYIQGVTTLGTSCTGMKVDGLLHNGGNKSMTANDYTQVLSDGIGAWVLNNARVELVSVFTYYNQVGYLAEDGGIIRATNGNNSYGTWGAVADGIDPNETPLSAKVWNRDNEAIVDSVFAGEFSDEIFAMQFNHAGESYTSVTDTITGAGVSANAVFEDFRTGGLFQSRLVNPDDSGATGGVGYYVQVNNASAGDATTFTLEVGDASTAAQIEGTRVWIVGGVGTGQYGYIQSFNDISKVASVYKESDNTPGWDHIVPGTAIEATLAANSQYRIEPRIQVSHPGFSNQSYNLPNGRTFTDVAFSETTFQFNDVEGQLGTGLVEEQDGLVRTAATFNIAKNGTTYDVTVATAGLGYAVGDTITILGSDLGGQTPANDCVIKVNTTTDDSSNSIASIVVTGVGRSGKFAAIATPNFVQHSDDGTSWTETTLPNSLFVAWKRVISGNNRFVAIASGTDEGAYSLDGVTWSPFTLPESAAWSDAAFGEGKFVVVGENTNTVAYSTDGITWSSTSIPDDLVGDSTASQWQAVTYGKGQFVAIAGNDRAVATSTNGVTWTRLVDALPAGENDFVSLEYGQGRYLALERTSGTLISFDGQTWQEGTSAPTQDGSTVMRWNSMKFADGIFFATCDANGEIVGGDLNGNNTTFVATSEDGVTWTGRNVETPRKYASAGFGVVAGVPYWVMPAEGISIGGMVRMQTGCRAKVRANMSGTGSFNSIYILDPGSGYTQANPPVFTVTDNTYTSSVGWENRVGNGVIAQPSWINRGQGYKSSSTRVTLSGDGFADIIPDTNIVKLYGLTQIPGPGTQLLFSNIPDLLTDDPTDFKSYRAAVITDLGDDGTGNGTKLVQIQISPRIRTENDLIHDTVVTLNQNFSQCRITGHDFLDIGTGNFTQTNYPTLYAGGDFFTAAPENEVYETNGGRIFYVSTDQDGNFRAGELFSVQQATGVVTISAEFFDLDGLSQLALGGVRLGGSGAVVREFSTDPTFAEDSNNVIPTQKAIATFLADRLSVGGSDLELNAIIAGQIYLGSDLNLIASNTGTTLIVPVDVDISGVDALGNPVGIQGSWVQQMLYHRNFEDGMK